MIRPTSDALRFAAEWLRAYDPDDFAFQDATLVAEWLDEQADAQFLRNAARENSLSVSQLRAKIKELSKD